MPVAVGGHVVAPGGDLARGDSRDAVVAEPAGLPGGGPVQMPGDLLGGLVGADPAHGQLKVALDPHGQAVVGVGEAAMKIDYLS
ncbi:hypothetical protein J5X84_39220 [Streptosporangiaceae bacterium NEAU-GS5]|nr:hypothetical protein [Streptosporangiaceae bacterium NEAU-GS5]